MEQEKIAHFESLYRGLSEWDIEDLDARKQGLTEEARVALAEIIAERQVNLDAIRKEVVDESVALAKQAERKEQARSVKDRKLTKLLLIASIPLTFVIFLIRPDRTFETLVSTGVQVIGLAVIGWGLSTWRRRK